MYECSSVAAKGGRWCLDRILYVSPLSHTVSKALLKSSASASVLFPRLKFDKVSCRTLATHSVVLWPALKPNCSLGMFWSIPNIFNLVSSTRSASLLNELSKETGRYEEGSSGFLPGLRMGMTMDFFHCRGKYCSCTIAFIMCENWTTAFLVRFLIIKLGISSGPGDLFVGSVLIIAEISFGLIRSLFRSGGGIGYVCDVSLFTRSVITFCRSVVLGVSLLAAA